MIKLDHLRIHLQLYLYAYTNCTTHTYKIVIRRCLKDVLRQRLPCTYAH